MSITTRNPASWCSIVVADSIAPRVNHAPVAVVDVTRDGVELTVWVMVGLEFHDADGVEVVPSGFLSNAEFFELRKMLAHTDDDGVEHPRTLPADWADIDAMVIAMRAESAQEQQPGNDQVGV